LLDEARLVLRSVDRLEQVAAQLANNDANEAPSRLSIGFCHGAETIARLAARRFHERRPDVSIQPSALTSLRMFDDLLSGKLAVGIVRNPIPRPDVLASQLLGRIGFDHVAVPENHPLACRNVITPADLTDEPVMLVSRAEAPTYHDATIGYCAQHGARPKWVEHSATQVERMLDMVSVGSGIGWLNAFQATHIQHPGVVIVPLQPVTRVDEFHLAWRVDDHSRLVADFVAIAIETVQEGS
jgi:DNA-binding transcriptional LysR family regulator